LGRSPKKLSPHRSTNSVKPNRGPNSHLPPGYPKKNLSPKNPNFPKRGHPSFKSQKDEREIIHSLPDTN